MTFGTSIFLIAVGAILRFAVYVSASGFSIHTVGLILMIVGGVGLVASLVWLSVWSERARARRATQAPDRYRSERDPYGPY